MTAPRMARQFPIPSSTTERASRVGGTIVLREAQVRNLLRRAALNPHGKQFLQVNTHNGAVDILLLKNAPGGILLVQPADAGSFLACCLGVALERMGCLHKLGIAGEAFGFVPVWTQGSFVPEYLPSKGVNP